jgi:hypothetical protein
MQHNIENVPVSVEPGEPGKPGVPVKVEPGEPGESEDTSLVDSSVEEDHIPASEDPTDPTVDQPAAPHGSVEAPRVRSASSQPSSPAPPQHEVTAQA